MSSSKSRYEGRGKAARPARKTRAPAHKKLVHAKQVARTLHALPHQTASVRELARAMRLKTAAEQRGLGHCVRSMLKKGDLQFVGKRLHLTQADARSGRIIAHPDGYGFVRLGQGRESDVFVPREEMQGIMHGDRVTVSVSQRRGRQSAKVLNVLEEAASIIVGQFSIHGGVGIVEPRSRRQPQAVIISKKDAGGAHAGDWVRIQLIRESLPLKGRVLERLDDVLQPGRLIDLVIAEQAISEAFPDAALNQAEAVPARTGPFGGRRDLTHLPFVTIDGEDARDFDDAICVLPRGEGFEAWVAIADVAHYVPHESPLDREAAARGNSFYFPDRVIPMLPETLSNGICSLNPDVDRLALVVRMRYDAGGRRRAIHIYEAVIRSRARLTYTQVGQLLEAGDKQAVASAEIRDMLMRAAVLYQSMDRLRKRRGALDLNLPEVRAVIHEESVQSLQLREDNIAHRLIEEMMLAANTAVARYFEERSTPVLYRIHETPDPTAIEQLNAFLDPLGLHLPLHANRPPAPAEIQHVLEKSEGSGITHVLHRLILRAMKQARYSPDNKGHFGLAYKSYCHFTSPIRRYADLTVHRRLKAIIKGNDPDRTQPASELGGIGEKTSAQERKQVQAEWDTTAMLSALHHAEDVGKQFAAVISGVTERRLFFELQPTLAEGSLAVDSLQGNYVLDKSRYALVASHGGQSFHLGDRVNVVIESTDPVRGLINVSLA